MNKTILFTLLALLGMTQTIAQEYEYVPFVREGVKWVYYIKNTSDIYGWIDHDLPNGNFYLTLELKGDTVINGISFKAMHKYAGENINQQNDTIPLYLREEDKVVYGIIPDCKKYPDCPIGNYYTVNEYNGEEFVLYDFKNPINYWSSFLIYEYPLYEYQNTDTIVIGNHLAKRYNGLWSGADFHIIEGVGADTPINGYTLLFFMPTGPLIPFYHLSHVIENGEIVYKGILFDSDNHDGIDEVVADQNRMVDDNYYNLMGQPVGKQVPTTPGIYIHNGKKICVRQMQ